MKDEPTIVIDSREQLPYEFAFPSVIAALPAGDYSIVGFESSIAIERKSLNDLVNTIIHSRERFAEELEKLINYDAACIVVEAGWEDVITHKYTSQATPASVIGAVMAIIVDKKIPIYFCGNRQIARAFIQGWLVRQHKKASEICQSEQSKPESDSSNRSMMEKKIEPTETADTSLTPIPAKRQRKKKDLMSKLPAELVINSRSEEPS